MPKRNYLLLAAVAGLAMFLCMVLGFSVGIQFHNPDQIREGNDRRQSVENSMETVLPAGVRSADSPELAQAVERLKAEPYILWVWVTDPNGEIRISYNGPSGVGENVNDLSNYEEDLILSVDPTQMDPVTEMELRLAMALRREGEHNDIYGHMVRYIPGPDGKPAAFVGVTFEEVDSAPGIWDIVFAILGAAGISLYWLGLPLWTALDSRAGGSVRASVLWGLFVLVTNAAGLLAYLLVKHRTG